MDQNGHTADSHARQGGTGEPGATDRNEAPAQKGGTEQQDGISSIEQKLIENQVIEAIRTCYDPEIPVNIYDMGLVYDVRVDARGAVTVIMTLTSPHCPAAQTIPKDVETKARAVPGVTASRVEVVWSPPWNPSMMSEAARLELGF